MKHKVYVLVGLLMVALGTAGIFLPLVPTTPFLLLAAYLFSRGSRRWHDWLMNQRYLGPYIHAWKNKSGFTVAQKVRIILSLSLAMSISICFSPMLAVKYLLGTIWVFWSIVLVLSKTDASKAVTI